MQQLLREMEAWRREGRRFALARVLGTWGSAPRQPGAAMIVDDQGRVLGSVSSGCVESDLMERAQACITQGTPERISYGVPDEKAWSVGLSCGGQLDVWLEPFWGDTQAAVWQDLLAADTANADGVLLTLLKDGGSQHTWLDADFEGGPVNWTMAMRSATSGWAPRQSGLVQIEGQDYFVHRFRPRSRIIILGAGPISMALVQILDVLGHEMLVLDPRAVFTEADRFAGTRAQVLTAWPQEVFPTLKLGPEDYVVLLSHDPRMDDPAIEAVLRKPVAYIGALGSGKSHAKRQERLLAKGYTEEELQRIHAPIGLKLGGQNPAEIALGIAAQIVQVRNGK